MSHFAVMVIGELSQLEAFHEFECTGDDNQYVKNIDKLDEYSKEFKEELKTYIKSPEGEYFDTWEDQFYRDPTPEESSKHSLMGTGWSGEFSFTSKDWGDGKGYRPKIHYIPEGYEEVTIPYSERMTFVEFLEDYHALEDQFVYDDDELDLESEHKYGWVRINSETDEVLEIVDRTNPNSKWDWWVEGGRYAGRLKIKKEFTNFYINQNPNFSWGWDEKSKLDILSSEHVRVDKALKEHIDWDGMIKDGEERAAKEYDDVINVIGHLPKNESWDSIKDRFENIDDARDFYHLQPRNKALKDAGSDYFWKSAEDYDVSREDFIFMGGVNAVTTYAFIKDGNWYERGKMGWWGLATDEMDKKQWSELVLETIKNIPDETMITVVDCHI